MGTVTAVSQPLQSSAIGPGGQPDFVNAAVGLETNLSPGRLRSRLRQIEAELGRRRSEDKYAPRPIDIDLVLYDDFIHEGAEGAVPDPDLLTRAYLATTVAELDPGAEHPLTHETMGEIAARLGGDAQLVPRLDIDLGRPAAGRRNP